MELSDMEIEQLQKLKIEATIVKLLKKNKQMSKINLLDKLDYDIKYTNYKHQYYNKAFFYNIATQRNYEVKIFKQNI